jgi:hypothetical protein
MDPLLGQFPLLKHAELLLAMMEFPSEYYFVNDQGDFTPFVYPKPLVVVVVEQALLLLL